MRSCGTLSAVTGEPASLAGTWANGAPATPAFSGVSVPVHVVGGSDCPTSATSSAFNAAHLITDVTDPASQSTVTG